MVSKTTGSVLSDGELDAAVPSAKRGFTYYVKMARQAYLFLCGQLKKKVRNKTLLTLAAILEVRPDPLAVVDERSLGVEVSAGPVGEGLVVQVEQLAVVLGSLGGAFIQERPAEELVLYLAGQPAGGLAGHLELLVRVVVQGGVLGHLVVGDADPGHLEDSVGCNERSWSLEFCGFC